MAHKPCLFLCPYKCTRCPTFGVMDFAGNYCHDRLISNTGQNTAVVFGSYKYRFRYWCVTVGVCGGGSFGKELYWLGFRNWIHFYDVFG